VDGVTLGANGGAQSHQLTVAQMPVHTHPLASGLIAVSGLAAGTQWNQGGSTTTGNAGGDTAHPNVQPTFIVNKIIKYTVSGTVLPIIPGDGDVTGPASSVDGDLAVFNGTSGKVVTGASSVGSTVQTVYCETAAVITGTALIPADDTMPQWTEGTQCSFGAPNGTITPRYTNSLIIGRISGEVGISVAAATATLAMFRGTGPNAIAATGFTFGGVNYQLPTSFTFQDLPGVTTAVQYNMRFGPHSAATVTFNGVPTNGTRMYGGVSKTSFILEEIKQ
jgi:hypothetical protein